MRMGFVSWKKSTAPLLIVLTLSAPGCKSGWKAPGAGMWPWSRTPSAETLATTTPKPSLESPATKHTPSAIASTAAGGKSATSPGTGIPASTVGYPGATAMASAPTSPSPYGSAATANGYQTGPYGMTAQAGSAPSTTGYPASGSYSPTSSYAGNAGLPSGTQPSNPYAPPATRPTSTPPSGTPASMASMPTAGALGSTTTQPAPAGSYSMPNATPSVPSSMPSYNPALPAGVPGTMASFPTSQLPPNMPMHSASVGSMSAPNISMPSPPSPTATLPSSTYAGGTPIPAAPTATTPADGYRPGTTARSTAYNFSGSGATVPVNSQATVPSTSIPLPPSGSGTGYGSFQLPPNTAATPNAPQQPTYR